MTVEIKKENLIKLLIIGILGAVSTMIGDCLLLGADSSGAADKFDMFTVIASEISYTRIGLAGFFGFIGIPVTAVGFSAFYFLIKDRGSKAAKAYMLLMLSSFMAMGGAVHIICCYMMTGIKKNLETGAEDIVITALKEQLGFIIPCLAVFLILYAAADIVMLVLTAKGKTILPKWMWILNPLIMKGLINFIGGLGSTAFFNGLGGSNMSLGSIIILGAWIIVIKKNNTEAHA